MIMTELMILIMYFARTEVEIDDVEWRREGWSGRTQTGFTRKQGREGQREKRNAERRTVADMINEFLD